MKKPNYNLTESNNNNNESSVSNSSSNSVSTLPPIMQLSSAYAMHCELHKNISTKLKYYSSSTIGLPACLAISNKFIGIGTQKGIICIFDLYEEPRQQLSLHEQQDTVKVVQNNSSIAVTSMDFSYNTSDTVIAGHASGIIILWDLLKGIII